MKKAIFPGSFDPFTIGHYSIVTRGLGIFDQIIIAIGNNPAKKSFFPIEKRIEIAKMAFKDEPRVVVKAYNELTVDFAVQEEAGFILRGLRTTSDYEYEQIIADTNYKLSGIETVLLFTEAQYSSISSTITRELITYGKDVSDFLPPGVSI